MNTEQKPAVQTVDDAERANQLRKLEAIIEATVMQRPDLKGKLNTLAAWQYMQLPDVTFGWSDGSPMGWPQKTQCVITTLSLDLMPGHVIWMGNGVYATAAAWLFMVNRDVPKLTGMEFRPFSEAEKEMFGIQPGDLHCVVEQKVLFGGHEAVWIGHGVIGSDELTHLSAKGHNKIGMKTTRDRVQFLKTRAIRDMNTRNFPIAGLRCADDMNTEELPPPQAMNNVTPQAKAKDEKDAAEADAKIEWLARINTLLGLASAQGKTADDILGMDFKAWAEKATSAEIHDAADVIEEWLADNKPEPDPNTTPPNSPAKAPKPAAPASGSEFLGPDGQPIKRGPGKPPKAALQRMHNLILEVAKVGYLPADVILGVDFHPWIFKASGAEILEACDALDKWLADNAAGRGAAIEAVMVPAADEQEFLGDTSEDIQNDVFEDGHSADGLQDEFEQEKQAPEPEIYTGTDAQKEILRVTADAAGHTDNAFKHALAGAMRNRPMKDLDRVIVAMGMVKKPETLPTAKTTPPENAVSPNSNSTALPAARDRLRAAIDYVTKTGGAPMHVAKVNPLNALDGGTAAEMNRISDLLEAWTPAANTKAPAVIRRVEAAAPAAPTPADPLGDMPTSGIGVMGYAMLRKAYVFEKATEKTKAMIVDLGKRQLKDVDHVSLPQAIRKANSGDYKDLQAFISSRPLRG